MLRKLLKHEFHATGRIMLPLLGAELLLSVLAGLSVRGLTRVEDMGFLGFTYGMTVMVFFLGLFAVGVVATVLMVQRFYRNLLRDEGYLAMTLPVSVDAHICSKLIVSFVWFTAVALLFVLAMLVMLVIGAQLEFMAMEEFQEVLRAFREALRLVGGGNLALFVLEYILLSFLGAAGLCLRCYSAMAIGCSAANHKLLYSFLAFIGIGFVLNILQNALAFSVLPQLNLFDFYEITGPGDVAHFFHHAMGVGAVLMLIYNAIFYFLTRWFLSNRLNLA